MSKDVRRRANIYCLVDPRNGWVFYVGATACKLKTRLSHHMSFRSFRKGKIMSAREFLIQQIVESGKKPLILLLEEVGIKDRFYVERAYFNAFRSLGTVLIQSSTDI